VIERPDPELLAKTISEMLDDENDLKQMAENTKFAASELNWQKEEATLKPIYEPLKR